MFTRKSYFKMYSAHTLLRFKTGLYVSTLQTKTPYSVHECHNIFLNNNYFVEFELYLYLNTSELNYHNIYLEPIVQVRPVKIKSFCLSRL